MGFWKDVARHFEKMGDLPESVFSRRRKKRAPQMGAPVPVRHAGTVKSVRLSREEIVGRFVEFCLDRKEEIDVCDERHMVLVFSGACEEFLSELEPWQQPYVGWYRDALHYQAEQNGYFYEHLIEVDEERGRRRETA